MKRDGVKERRKQGRKERRRVYVFLFFMPPGIAHKQYALLTSLSSKKTKRGTYESYDFIYSIEKVLILRLKLENRSFK